MTAPPVEGRGAMMVRAARIVGLALVLLAAGAGLAPMPTEGPLPQLAWAQPAAAEDCFTVDPQTGNVTVNPPECAHP
jgi:hypothetical protein